MDRDSLGPLTFRQRLFWVVALAVLVFDALALLATVWPSGACGCGG